MQRSVAGAEGGTVRMELVEKLMANAEVEDSAPTSRAPELPQEPERGDSDLPPEEGLEPLQALVALGRYFHRYRNLLLAFVVNDLKFRYVGSSIGFFWTVIDPVLELAIYTFVFSVLLKVRFAPDGDTIHYALFLFCGMITWFNVQETLTRSTSIIGEHAHLIKKLPFPCAILPSHLVLSGMINQVIRTFILLVGMVLAGYGLSAHALLIPVVMGLQLVFTLGMSMLVATVAVYFKDITHLIKAALMIWMFVTPIFYPPSSYPREFSVLLVLNPLAHLVGMYQELLLNQRLPHQGSIIIFVVTAVFVGVVGGYIFARFQDRFADLV